MKKIIGFLIVLLSIAFATIAILRIWGVEIISLGNLVRSATTLAVLGGLLIFLLICWGFFFRNSKAGFNPKVGNRAHPRD
jgi:hypothetical protein